MKSDTRPATGDLADILSVLGRNNDPGSLGADIDAANVELLNPDIDPELKKQRFRQWARRHQPCLFGRLGAKGAAGVNYDLCWIDRDMLCRGSQWVSEEIQRARESWKHRAARGLSHGFLIMFNAPELACARPGPELLDACRALCDLYLIEHAPVEFDTIYTESVPFHQANGDIICLRGGINVFYGGAHRTRNHDRRVPGGILVSVNSPGVLAHSMVSRGLAPDLNAALEKVRNLAWASIGNGGHALEKRGASSCTWHNRDADRPAGECPMKHRPSHVPEDFSADFYSAHYHTDVLLPSSVMSDLRRDLPRAAGEVWRKLDFEYITAQPFDEDHESHGFVHGTRVDPDMEYRHRWAPRLPSALTDLGEAS
ncbi:MAG: hypothetical protein U1F39_00760 [Steroidobacteraceae bacterium]